MNQQQFYKTKKWETFRKIIVDQNLDADGYVHCARCGKPILKKYDLIVHHKQELSDENVNDYSVSLNPDNVECVCFSCHNRIHERFQQGSGNGGWKPVQKRVYIVYGAPCAGKSTWVNRVATDQDLVVDMDNIWQMISINERYVKPSALKSVVFQIRDQMYDIIKHRSGSWHCAYVITGGALQGDRERLRQRIGADDLIYIDASIYECIQRVKQRDMSDSLKLDWMDYINDWFEMFQPDDPVDDTTDIPHFN